MSEATRYLEARAIQGEIDRLRGTRGRGLTVDMWEDGRCKVACSSGMRICAWSQMLGLLREIPSDASWQRIWTELFDFPEAPE